MHALVKSPEYEDFTVRQNVHLDYTYEVEGKTFEGSVTRKRNSSNEVLKPGDTVEVLVSNTDPTKSRWN